jgi:hypothetical protein
VFWSLVISVLQRILEAGGWTVVAPEQPLLLALATLAVGGLLVLATARLFAARREQWAALARVRTTMRERSLRTAFLPQRDPDAAGRPRPRAPGTVIAAA